MKTNKANILTFKSTQKQLTVNTYC